MKIGRIVDVRILIEIESNKMTFEREFRTGMDGLTNAKSVINAFLVWIKGSLLGYIDEEHKDAEQLSGFGLYETDERQGRD